MHSRNLQRGSALLTVLWLTAALAAIGLAVANTVRGETERASTNIDESRATFIARGAIARALLRMQWGGAFYSSEQRSMNFDFPSATAQVEIIPETSRLNVNTIQSEQLILLLSALGVPADRAIETTAAIVDWRTPDILHSSPFDGYYRAQTPSFFARHASFTENEELLLVRGVTADLYYGPALGVSGHAGLRDCLSVYGSSGVVDANTARAETMIAAGLSATDAQSIVNLRLQRPLGMADVQQIALAAGAAGGRVGMSTGTMFTIRATARLKAGNGGFSDLRRSEAALVKFWRPGNTMRKAPGAEIIRWMDRP